ncbi:MAG: amidohydrolase [Bacteroidales bacterium]|nr:amidohydrolase [Bacteroidales bacterium]
MTAEILRILILQTDIIWKDTCGNLKHFDDLLQYYNQKADLVLLPELFTTGFLMTPGDISTEMQAKAVTWLNNKAFNLNSSIAGSMIIKQNKQYYNRLICAHPSSDISIYDKRHLFRMEGELKHYSRGMQRSISVINGWRICWQICYDLRFPVWSRCRNDYDVLVYVANWPAKRNDVWKTLLKARAIENQSYVIGVNRIGTDGNGIDYIGESCVIDPKGNLLNDLIADHEKLISAELNYTLLKDFREIFPVLSDADKFTIE